MKTETAPECQFAADFHLHTLWTDCPDFADENFHRQKSACPENIYRTSDTRLVFAVRLQFANWPGVDINRR